MSWNLVCKLDELPAQGGREVMIGTFVLAIFRTSDGVFAVDAMCAHQGGPLAQGTLDGKCITCPWHGWQYDVSSGCNQLMGRKMLTTYPVEIRDDEVWVDA